MKNIIKRLGYLVLILMFSLSLIGCGSKAMELEPFQKQNIEMATEFAVSSEVYSKYGLVPGMTIDKITAHDASIEGYYRITFSASGSYTVSDAAGDLYSGTFKVKGYTESHGSGCDSCEITAPKNGTVKLPEQSVVETSAAPETSAAETTVPVLQSDKMIKLSEQYENDGYNIMICDPSAEFEEAYGALEYFRAFNDNSYFEVFFYDSAEAASNAEYMMYGDGSDRTTSDGAATQIVEGTILVAEHTR